MTDAIERLLDAILSELQKFNNRMENMQSIMNDWQGQDEEYHKRNERIMKGGRA